MTGHIKIDRKILDWEWYSDVNTCRLFIHILLRANWKAGRFKGAEIPRGSFATSYANLAQETGLSVQNVRTSLNRLKSTGEITMSRGPKYSVITVKNYDHYQLDNTVANKQLTGSQQATNTKVTTIEEGKKGRSKEENTFSGEKVSGNQQPDDHIFTTIRELYHSVCGSYPRLLKMSEARKKAVRARLNTGYTLEDFETLFKKAEASDFLRGKNKRNWVATFDWLIADANMAKVLDGNYDNKDNKEKQEGAEHGIPESSVSARLW